MGANAGEDLLKLIVKVAWYAIKGLFNILTFVFRWGYKKYQEKKAQPAATETTQSTE